MWQPLPLDHARITVIGNTVMKMPGKVIGVGVNDIQEKIDWYLAEIPRRFPKIIIIDHNPGPTEGCHFIRVQRKNEGMA